MVGIPGFLFGWPIFRGENVSFRVPGISSISSTHPWDYHHQSEVSSYAPTASLSSPTSCTSFSATSSACTTSSSVTLMQWVFWTDVCRWDELSAFLYPRVRQPVTLQIQAGKGGQGPDPKGGSEVGCGKVMWLCLSCCCCCCCC